MTIEEAWIEIKRIGAIWKEHRNSKDITGLQWVRDEISEALLNIGELETEIFNKLVLAEQKRKECVEDGLEAAKTEYADKKVKTNMDFIKNSVNIGCREFFRDEQRLVSEHHSIKTLMARADQILHSVSTSIRMILKID